MADENTAAEQPLDMEEVCFQIIANVGMAKSMYIDAIAKAKEGEIDAAREMVKQGSDAYVEGHNVHLQLLANDAGGKSVPFSMLLMHAEDQLLAAESFRIIAEDFIDVYEKLKGLEA